MMTIDEALKIVLNKLNGILIPASETEKMQAVKGNIQEVITAVRDQRAIDQQKKEAKAHEDDHDKQE